MKIGVVFPQTEIGQDPATIRDYAQAVESLGYSHILAFDSVIGANPNRPGGWDSPYTYQHAFHEPFALFAFCAAITRRIELVTGVLVLPQRQTTLVAKQAAEVDVLSGGRLRLGIGVGWNPVEFEALGENLKNRGKRVEEQLEVMRLLWTKELVTYAGRWHRVPDAGIKPLPVQQPIPVWMGGESEAVLRRAARLADGWITLQTFRPGPAAQQTVDRLLGLVREAGRDPAAFGIEGRLALAQVPAERREQELATWRAMRGITHLCVNTMGLGLPGPEEHVRTLERFKRDVLG
ncbi:MAG TPA: LLM class F420-dependent oxidoreductase [Candidatus Dormibacteraeota bacterium]|jgi:probable F420-dependent oxidoreductase|nr:LLM class F420-dependent oxidoreductase [Candidatus Dormibacteraeota bacterium]